MLPGVYLPGQNPASSVRLHTDRTQQSLYADSTAFSEQEEVLPELLRLIKFIVHDSKEKDENEKYLEATLALNEGCLTGKNPIIGEGHHFVVFAVPYHHSDTKPIRALTGNPEIYCVKYPNPLSRDDAGFHQEICETVLQEISVLCHPAVEKHDNIIKLLGLEVSEDYDDYTVPWPCLCMEYADFGTLDSFMVDQGKIGADLARQFLLDSGRGLQCLHSCNIIHGDIKSENILICRHARRKYIAKLSDFGLSLTNPDPEKTHFLLGSTWMWEAPEAHAALSVEGLKLTDVYSFGLVVWRILVNRSIPYELFWSELESRYQAPTRDDFIKAVKADPEFPFFVKTSMLSCDLPDWMKLLGQTVIDHTLSRDPSIRNLDLACSSLAGKVEAGNDAIFTKDIDFEARSAAYWESQQPETVIEKIFEAYPDNYLFLRTRPSAILALIRELKQLSTRNGTIGFHATHLAFRFATSPELRYSEKTSDEICRLYMRLCELGSLDHIASLPFYFRMVGRPLSSSFDPEWLEVATDNHYYMGQMALSTEFPTHYQEWLNKTEESATSTYPERSPEMLLTHLRLGNYEQSKALLNAGVSPFSEDENPSAIHWLVSFSDETQIMELACLILASGGLLDSYLGDSTVDILSAKTSGTPLHWACMQRNIPVVRVLCELDSLPARDNIVKAFVLASALHFSDVLEILQKYIKPSTSKMQPILSSPSDIAWAGLTVAAASSQYHLPRLLRHGTRKAVEMMLKTVEMLFMLYSPTEAQQHGIMSLATSSGNADLIQYLITKFDLHKKKPKCRDKIESYYTASMMLGHYEAFEVILDSNLVSPKDSFVRGTLTALQGCCAVRQRNPAFMQKLLDLGCHPDELGPNDPYALSPFGMAVSLGLYDCAILLLHRGADKEFKSGWMGGQTTFVSTILQLRLPN
jgi:serine/threonine protein kinase